MYLYFSQFFAPLHFELDAGSIYYNVEILKVYKWAKPIIVTDYQNGVLP